MTISMSDIALSGVCVRASFARAFLWLLACGALAGLESSSLSSQLAYALYGALGGATILLSGLALQKILEATTIPSYPRGK